MEPSPAMGLAVEGATKRFGNALALDNVSLSVAPGSVRALVGANGSGKSTLIKALAGYHVLDAGVVSVHGHELNPHRLGEQAKAAGLRFVHQDLALIPSLDIIDNLAMERGYLVKPLGTIDWKREEELVRRQLAGVGAAVNPRTRIASLGPVDRTLVAIARALDRLDSRLNVLILDEPTARLPQSEAARLIARLEELKRRGLPIIYVTHRLDEVFRLADTVTVLRDGREALAGPLSAITPEDLRHAITGTRRVDGTSVTQAAESRAVASGEVVLELTRVSTRRLTGVSLRLHRGELLGVTGLVGSGKSELGRIVYGLQTHAGGEIVGRSGSYPSDTGQAALVGYLPQDRRAGLFLDLSTGENITITAVRQLKTWLGLSRQRLREAALSVIGFLRIQPGDPRIPVGVLSGGNQQKVALGKWLQLRLAMLILDEPTQAIDIGTKHELMTKIKARARAEGLAVLWLESDIEELVKYADRIIVMSNGRISAEFSQPPFNLPQVLSEAYRTVEDPQMIDEVTKEVGDVAHPRTEDRAEPARFRTALRLVWSLFHNFGLLVALVVLIGLFSFLRPNAFPTAANAGSILTGSAALAMIAIGIMLPLIVQQYDLSAGFMATMASLLVVGLQSFDHAPVWLSILVALAASGFVGLLSGILVAYARLNSLVVTLAVGSLLFGAAQLYSNGATIYQDIPQSFLAIGQSRIAGVPLPFIYVMIAALIIWHILEHRPLGRQLYAIGGGEEGARLVGIRVERRVVLMFVGAAVMAGLGGVVQSARVGSANASILQTLLLPAFTAAFLGATSIRPGQYNVWGTVLAVYLVGVGTTGIFMLGVPSYIEPVFNGLVLLVAIGLAHVSARRLASS